MDKENVSKYRISSTCHSLFKFQFLASVLYDCTLCSVVTVSVSMQFQCLKSFKFHSVFTSFLFSQCCRLSAGTRLLLSFRHNLPDRLSRGEEVSHCSLFYVLCFYFLVVASDQNQQLINR